MAAKANFNAYHNYATDSLHQWDLNQVLTLRGLNLATAPEVHFSNKNMDRAIVRQATMVNHVVTVNIPNSLLQDPLRIYAHIGIYEGSTFTVVETVEIPVIPRVRPLDYQIEDADSEVYSFKMLENKMANMVTRREADAITARVDAIVTGGTADGNTELIDIRAGLDGKVYGSAGTAVRAQLADIYDCFLLETGANVYNPDSAMAGYVMQHDGTLAEDAQYTLSGFIHVPHGYAVMATCAQAAGGRATTTADATAQIIKSVCVFATDRVTIIPEQGSSSQVGWYANVTTAGDKWVRVTFKPATCPDLMLEVVPAVNGATTGEPNAYQTGLTLAGMTEFVEYSVQKTLRPECKTLSWYYGKKVATFGDSITELNLWQPHIARHFGCEVVNCGVGGSRVANYPAGERTDYMCGDERIGAIPADADVILVFGGHNDFSASVPFGEITPWWTLTDDKAGEFYAAYALMLKKLVETFPAAKIITLSCVGGRTSGNTDNMDGQWYLNGLCMEDYAEAVKRISRYYGIPCIDVGGESGINTLNHATYIADVVHPNAEGGKLIAGCVINGMKRFEPVDL